MGQTRKRHDNGTFKAHVRKGDEVIVLAGRSLGQRGRVVTVDPQRERATVEGVNLVTKHQRSQSQNVNAVARQQSGRIERPSPIHVSNLQIVCPACNKQTRIAHKEVEGRSVRSCKQCGEVLDRPVER